MNEPEPRELQWLKRSHECYRKAYADEFRARMSAQREADRLSECLDRYKSDRNAALFFIVLSAVLAILLIHIG